MVQLNLLPVYCIDTSTLINLKHYPPDIFPSLWKEINDLAKQGQIISHKEVFKELENVKDDIYKWCKKHRNIFKTTDKPQIKNIQNIKNKYDVSYWNNEINKPTPWADPWIISLAICKNAFVIADEANKPNKIPFICSELNVKPLNRFEFFREIGIKL